MKNQHLETLSTAGGPHGEESESITGLLAAWRRGQQQAMDRLMVRIYPQLCAMAAARMPRNERQWTLQPAEVVHEAYFKLMQQNVAEWNNQAQFFKIAARVIGRVIVDHARHRCRKKRGAGQANLPLSQICELSGIDEGPQADELLSELLVDLSRIEVRAARVVQLRVFCGMQVEEAAQLLRVSPRTVARDWRFARAWLKHQLVAGGHGTKQQTAKEV